MKTVCVRSEFEEVPCGKEFVAGVADVVLDAERGNVVSVFPVGMVEVVYECLGSRVRLAGPMELRAIKDHYEGLHEWIRWEMVEEGVGRLAAVYGC